MLEYRGASIHVVVEMMETYRSKTRARWGHRRERRNFFSKDTIDGNPNNLTGVNQTISIDINLKLRNSYNSTISIGITAIGGFPENFTVRNWGY